MSVRMLLAGFCWGNHIFWQVVVWPLAAKPAEWVVCEGPISRDVLQRGGKKPTTVTGEATAAM